MPRTVCIVSIHYKPCGISKTFAVKQPRGRKYERDVHQHVDHAQPIDGHLFLERVAREGFVVVVTDRVTDNVQMDPLETIHGDGVGVTSYMCYVTWTFVTHLVGIQPFLH